MAVRLTQGACLCARMILPCKGAYMLRGSCQSFQCPAGHQIQPVMMGIRGSSSVKQKAGPPGGVHTSALVVVPNDLPKTKVRSSNFGFQSPPHACVLLYYNEQ